MPSVKLYKTNLALEVFIRIDNKYFSKKEKIFGIAVSGGPDSMLLFSLLNKWTKDNKKKLKVFTFNHNLRRESLNEGYFALINARYFKPIIFTFFIDTEILYTAFYDQNK